jgi:hypothetical protein
MYVEKRHDDGGDSCSYYDMFGSLRSWFPKAKQAYSEFFRKAEEELKDKPGKVSVVTFNRV